MDRNLRIRMLLEAGDRFSKPLRDLASGGRTADAALKGARDRLKEIERTKADVDAFRKLKTDSLATGRALEGAKTKVGDLSRAMAQAETPRSAKKRVVKVGSGTGEARRLARTYASEAGARAAAQAEFGRAARASRKLDLGLALGRLEIYPDRPVTVSGFKAPIDATTWMVSDVTHELVAFRGFTTALSLQGTGG